MRSVVANRQTSDELSLARQPCATVAPHRPCYDKLVEVKDVKPPHLDVGRLLSSTIGARRPVVDIADRVSRRLAVWETVAELALLVTRAPLEVFHTDEDSEESQQG